MSGERRKLERGKLSGARRRKVQKESARQIPSGLGGGTHSAKSMWVNSGNEPGAVREWINAREGTDCLTERTRGERGGLVLCKKESYAVATNGFARTSAQITDARIFEETSRRECGRGECVRECVIRVGEKGVHRSVEDIWMPRGRGHRRCRDDRILGEVRRGGDKGKVQDGCGRKMVEVDRGERNGVILIQRSGGDGEAVVRRNVGRNVVK